jgi:hypothetical protein
MHVHFAMPVRPTCVSNEPQRAELIHKETDVAIRVRVYFSNAAREQWAMPLSQSIVRMGPCLTGFRACQKTAFLKSSHVPSGTNRLVRPLQSSSEMFSDPHLELARGRRRSGRWYQRLRAEAWA